jgi:hypothetical protein
MIGYWVTGGAAAAERSALHLSPHKSPADAIEGHPGWAYVRSGVRRVSASRYGRGRHDGKISIRY